MELRHWLRAAANVANLSTLLGLLTGLAGGCRFRRAAGGLILAEGYRPRFPVAGAFTMGNVVIICGDDLAGLERRLPCALEHEDAHAWQYAYCLGLPFLPAYVAAMGWSWLRTGNWGSANPFEVQAGLRAGGYPEVRTIPLRERLSRGGGARSERPGAGRAGDAAA